MVSWADDDRPPRALGVLHPQDRCAYCGAPARGPAVFDHFDLIVIETTRGKALVCKDADACYQRRHGARQLDLFDGRS